MCLLDFSNFLNLNEKFGVDNETTKYTYKTKQDNKQELDESLINCERHNNTEIEEKARTAKKLEDAATVIWEHEEIIMSNWLV